MPSFPPSMRAYVLKGIIPDKSYQKLNHETKKEIIKMGLEKFRQELIDKHGSMANYNKYWLNKNGFKSQREYRIYLAERQGLKTYTQLLNYNKLEKEGKLDDYKIIEGRLKKIKVDWVKIDGKRYSVEVVKKVLKEIIDKIVLTKEDLEDMDVNVP